MSHSIDTTAASKSRRTIRPTRGAAATPHERTAHERHERNGVENAPAACGPRSYSTTRHRNGPAPSTPRGKQNRAEPGTGSSPTSSTASPLIHTGLVRPADPDRGRTRSTRAGGEGRPRGVPSKPGGVSRTPSRSAQRRPMARARSTRPSSKTRRRHRRASSQPHARTPSPTAVHRGRTESGDSGANRRRRHLSGRSTPSRTPPSRTSRLRFFLRETPLRLPEPSSSRLITTPRQHTSPPCASPRTASHHPRSPRPKDGPPHCARARATLHTPTPFPFHLACSNNHSPQASRFKHEADIARFDDSRSGAPAPLV